MNKVSVRTPELCTSFWRT